MKVLVGNLLVCLVLVAFGAGCSGSEEPSLPPQKSRVVKKIMKPPPKPVPKSVSETAAPPEKEEPEDRPVKETPEALPGKKDGTEETVPQTARQPSKPPEPAGTPEKTSAPPVKTPPPAVEAPEPKEQGIYVVKKGESLSGIAAKPEVYGDPLKWVVLYRMNLDKLGSLGKAADLPEKGLKEGLKLKVITPEEGEKNLKKRARHYWIVNILSATKQEKIVPPAVKMIQKGYPVYITAAKVKGKDWMRLRLGFYKDKASAVSDGEKVTEMLQFSGPWATKIPERELRDNGRF